MMDTEALRSVSDRLGAVPFEGTLEQRMTLVRAEVELVAAADEVDRLRAQHVRAIEQFNDVCERSDAKTVELNRLWADNERLDGEHATVKAQRDHVIGQYQAVRAVIENAPHDINCHYINLGNGVIERIDHCTCWKADVLA